MKKCGPTAWKYVWEEKGKPKVACRLPIEKQMAVDAHFVGPSIWSDPSRIVPYCRKVGRIHSRLKLMTMEDWTGGEAHPN